MGFRMSRSSGNKTLDIEKIYTSKRKRAALAQVGARGERHPADLCRCFLFWVDERTRSRGINVRKKGKNGCLRLNYCGDLKIMKMKYLIVVLLDCF